MRLSNIAAQSAVVSVCALFLMASNCNNTTGTPDSGPQELVCSQKSDCPDEFYECTEGVCRQPCGNDDVCEFGQFCTRAGYCQTGCRDTASCNDVDKLCVAGVCTPKSEVGTCATKDDCTMPPNTKVCVDNACQDPPANCMGPQDCPGPQQCNGFTRQCFNPNGDCMVSADCNMLTRCAGGVCSCTPDHQCVTTPVCTLATESTDCTGGTYCDVATTPSHCASSPSCLKQADCDATHLACNRTTRACERSATCTSTTQCSGRFNYCNVTAGFCQEPTCTNGGTTCMNGSTCQMDGTCSGGVMCTSNTDCPTGPPLQYCNAVNRNCAPGCRTDSDCNAAAMEKCNGVHACEVVSMSSSGGTGGGDGESCPNGDSDCRAGYVCSPGAGVCRETCQSGACPVCPQTGYGCFFGIYCVPFVMPDACTP